MICPMCGANNPDGTTFCSKCGSNLASNQNYSNAPSFSGNSNFNNFNAPGYNNFGYEPQKTQNGKGMAVASLVLGILGLTICPGITSVLALIFGIVAKVKGNKSGMATAGLILGIIAIVFAIIGTIVMFVAGAYVYNLILSVAPDLAYLFEFLVEDAAYDAMDAYAYTYDYYY